MNFSFSGCGFLGIYHVGVAAALKEYAPDLVIRKIAGASGGAIAACALICDLCLGQACSDVLRVAILARQRALGPLHPTFNLTNIIRNGLNRFLPDDAHKSATGRLHISLTRMSDGANVLVKEYQCKEDLVDAILCSAFIPFYSGTVPPAYQGVHYIDGGWSNNLPILDEHTVTVSPFSGEADICPADPESGSFLVFDLKNTTIRFTSENLYRVGVALFPPHPEVMSDMCRQGFEDTLKFLARHNLISCNRCTAIRTSVILATNSMDEETSGNSGDPCSTHDTVVGIRVLPKSFTHTQLGSVNGSECEKCFETAVRAPRKGLPRAVRRSLADASAKESTLLNIVYSSRPVTMLRYLLLPWMLPVDFVLSYFKKATEQFPSLYETSKEMINFALKQMDLAESRKDLAETFGLFEARASSQVVNEPSKQPGGSKLVKAEMNFGFSVTVNDGAKPIKRVPSSASNRKYIKTERYFLWNEND